MFLAFSWRRYDLRPALPSGPKALWGDSLLKTFYRAPLISRVECDSTMKKSERLDRKINRLFKAAGHPRWAHHMGPKKFQTWILCLGQIVKQVYQLSYRRAAKFLDEFYGIKLHWTTLQKAAKRLPKSLWQSLLAATIEAGNIALAKELSSVAVVDEATS